MPRTGLLTELAEKYGKSIGEIKSILMRTAIEAAKELYRKLYGADVKEVKHDFDRWRKCVGAAVRAMWRIVHAKKDIPTVEEIVNEALKEFGVTVTA